MTLDHFGAYSRYVEALTNETPRQWSDGSGPMDHPRSLDECKRVLGTAVQYAFYSIEDDIEKLEFLRGIMRADHERGILPKHMRKELL